MKGIKKIGSFALSMAMVAGLSTPVFATDKTEANIDGINVYHDGDLIATTDFTTGTDLNASVRYASKALYNLDGTLDAAKGATESKGNAYEGGGTDTYADGEVIKLSEGGVIKLTADTDNDSTVYWTIDGDSADDAKDHLTLSVAEDGTATIKAVNAYDADEYLKINVYSDKSFANDTDKANGKLTHGKFVELTIEVLTKKPTFTLTYDAKDNYYVDSTNGSTDEADAFRKAFAKPAAALPTVTNRDKDIKKIGSVKINHAVLGDTLDFSATNDDDDNADYNDYLSYVVAYPQDGDASAKYYATATRTAESYDGTVTVTGTAPKLGYAFVTYMYDGYGTDAVLYGVDVTENVYSKVVLDEGKEGKVDYTGCLLIVSDAVDQTSVYRLYNANTGEHFYTTDATETKSLMNVGWSLEKIGWYAPTSGTGVIRLYNSHVAGGEHLYTTSEKEATDLVAAGWTNEGVKFYSATSNYTPVYREYNVNAFSNNHNYTTSSTEHFYLVGIGWRGEGNAFYAVSPADSTLTAAEARAQAVAEVLAAN